MPDNASYQEILSVTADTTQFAKDLETLESLWNDFVNRVGRDNIGAAVSAGMFDGINKGLVDIKEILTSLTTKISENMDAMANSASKSIGTVKNAVEEAQIAAQKATDKIDAQLEKSQARQRANDEKRVRNFSESKEQAEESANTFDEQKQVRSFAEAKEKAQILAKDIDEKADVKESERAEERYQRLEEAANKQARDRESAQSKKQREMNQMFDSYSDEPETRTGTEDEFDLTRKQLEQERAERFDKEFTEHEREQRAHDEQGYRDTAGFAPENETGSPKPKFDEQITRKNPKEGGGIFGDLGGDLENIAKITIEFQLISAILGKLGQLVSAPFVALAQGEEYLKKTEMDAVDLEGALLTSVKYSSDLSENLKNTQQGSAAVTKALQDVAVSNPNVKLEDLQNSFKVISETLGGTGGVDTLQKMVQLSQDFSLAMRGAGVSTGNTRRLASELPQLFEGTLKPTSALARALGETPEQLHKLVEEGIKFNDIEERFAPLLAPFIQQAKDAKTTLEGTEEAAKLLSDRLTGAYATTEVAAYQEELQELIGKMNDPAFSKHAEQLGEWAKLWGQIKAATSSVPAFMAALSEGQDNAAKKMGFDPDGKGGYKHTNGGYDSDSGWTSSGGTTSGIPDLPLMNNPATDILNKVFTATGPKPTLGKKTSTPFDTSVMSSELEEYRAKLDAIKRVFDSIKEDNDLLVAGGGQNKSQASDAVSTAGKDASVRILQDSVATAAQLNASHKKELDNISSVEVTNRGSKTDEELSDSVNKKKQEANKRYNDDLIALGKSTTDALAALTSSEVSAERQAAQEKQQIQKGNFEANIAMAKKESEARIEAAENAASIIEKLYGFGLASQSDVQGAKRNVLTTRQSALTDEQSSINQSYGYELSNTAEGGKDRSDATNRFTSASAGIAQQLLQISSAIKGVDYDDAEIKRKSQEETLNFLLKSIALVKQYNDARNAVKEAGSSLIDSVFGRIHNTDPMFQDKAAQRATDIGALNLQKSGPGGLQSQLASQKDQTSPAALALRASIDKLDNDIKILQLDTVKDADAKIQAMRGNTPVGLQPSQSANILRGEIKDSTDSANDGENADDAATTQLEDQLKNLKPSLADFGNALQNLVFGTTGIVSAIQGTAQALKSGNVSVSQAMGQFATELAQAVTSVVGQITQAMNTYKQGKQAGGIMGGVGALASQYGGLIPVAGPFIQAAGAVLSLVGSIFTQEAQNIVNNINSQFSATMAGLANGQAGINQTLQTVMAERTQAIQQLSGIKGGQDQLQNILPQLNQEIAQLQAQQIQADQAWGATFNELAMQLQEGSNVGSQIMQNWVSINQQVYNYVNATGDATSATQFLSMTLQQLQITSEQQLTAGEAQAVQSAISLNQQLLQRTQLIESLNQQAFALQNQDSEERTEAGSVTRAQQLQLLQQQSQQQLQNLNFQITQSQQVVTAYSTVFTLSQDITGLWAQSNTDTLAALQIQLNGYKQLQQVVASITQGANGLFSSSQAWLNPITNPVTSGTTLTLSPGAVVVNIIAEDASNMSSVTADSITAALAQAARSGTPTGS